MNKQKIRDTVSLLYSRKVGISVAIVIVIGIVITAFFVHKAFAPTKLVNEKIEIKKIPQDIKKTINLQPIASISATIKLPILMYHYVEYVKDKKDTERQLLNVDPDIFEEQIKTLITAHFTFITAKELGDALDGKTTLPKNPIMLTFDDGHWDLDTDVLPILKKYNIRATAYIVSGFIGTNSDSLTASQLQDVISSGLVEIGAHTLHHISLKGKSLTLVQNEIDGSKSALEKQYHVHVYSFAYPYGSFDQQAIDVVKQAGFTTAVSTVAGNVQGNQNKFFLFRVRPGRLVGKGLLNYFQVAWHADKMFGE